MNKVLSAHDTLAITSLINGKRTPQSQQDKFITELVHKLNALGFCIDKQIDAVNFLHSLNKINSKCVKFKASDLYLKIQTEKNCMHAGYRVDGSLNSTQDYYRLPDHFTLDNILKTLRSFESTGILNYKNTQKIPDHQPNLMHALAGPHTTDFIKTPNKNRIQWITQTDTSALVVVRYIYPKG